MISRKVTVSLFFLAATFSFSISVHAATESAPAAKSTFGVENLYIDAGVFGSYSKGTLNTTLTSGSNPTLGQFGIGTTIGYWLEEGMFAGITNDFRMINQYSAVQAAAGNHHGTRFNLLAPTVGYSYDRYLIKANIQFLGNYVLSKMTLNKEKTSYQSPLGGGLSASYRGALAAISDALEPVYLGLQFDYVTFGKLGSVALSPKFKIWQLGLAASYPF